MTNDTEAAQGTAPGVLQPMSEVFISPMAQWYMGLRSEAQPGAAPAGVPPADGGQGPNGAAAQAGNGGGGFNWDLFPDIPVEQRGLLEPHLRNVQGHVTKLEQQYAPYKPVVESGLSGEDLQGLLNLQRSFNQDPVEAYLRLGADLQKAGVITDDLDLEALQQVLKGEEVQAAPQGAEPGAEGEAMPEWAKQIQRENQERVQREQQMTQQQKIQQQEQMLDQTIEGMKGQLKEAGLSDEQVNDPELDRLINAAIIASKGDADAAMKSILGFRDSTLKGLNPNPKPGDKGGKDELELPNGTPPVPKRAGSGRNREYAEARQGAAQFLARQHATSAQE